ncbi:hypothetical protein Tco_0492913 [Tanacetum coccineum]
MGMALCVHEDSLLVLVIKQYMVLEFDPQPSLHYLYVYYPKGKLFVPLRYRDVESFFVSMFEEGVAMGQLNDVVSILDTVLLSPYPDRWGLFVIFDGTFAAKDTSGLASVMSSYEDLTGLREELPWIPSYVRYAVEVEEEFTHYAAVINVKGAN